MMAHLLALAAAVVTAGFTPVSATPEVGRYKTLELVFTASGSPIHPFDTYLLKLEITDPEGKTFTIDGFYDGDGDGGQTGNVWKARLCPYMTGTWSWRVVPGDAPDSGLAGLRGVVHCVESDDRGGLIANGKYFRLQSGDPIYLVGNFLDLNVLPTHLYMGETVTDAERNAIIIHNRDAHMSNKVNVYFANKGDYIRQAGARPVTPWLGTASQNDKAQMDLSRWKLYDEYIRSFKDNGMFAEMWFFADDSDFGGLARVDKERLFRYAMARTSAFSHTLYVIALEWQEGWSHAAVTEAGNFIQAYNPWERPVSVHSLTLRSWEFSGENWATFIASQAGNISQPEQVNRYARDLWRKESIPHIGEEFGLRTNDSVARTDDRPWAWFQQLWWTLTEPSDRDMRIRGNLWANFCGGAAGSGTGSGLRAFQRFLSQSRIPFQRMHPMNGLVRGGGSSRFCLAEVGHHYLVYSQTGALTLSVRGSGLQGRWFNPRDPNASLGEGFSVSAGEQTFSPPGDTTKDWVLWISDGSNVTSGVVHPSPGATLLKMELCCGMERQAAFPPVACRELTDSGGDTECQPYRRAQGGLTSGGRIAAASGYAR